MSQRHEALKKADVVRFGGIDVCRQIAIGVMTVSEALDDPRAGHLQIGRVLCAQRRYGPSRAHRLLMCADPDFPIWPSRRVRELTDRQKALIVEALER